MTSGTITEPANARSRRSRAALLASARTILEEEGFEALTMTAVAGRSRLSRRSAYLHFPSRAALVSALFDYIAGTEHLDNSLARVWAAPDPVSALREWAAHLARYHPRLLAVDRAVERVRHHDTDAAAHRDRVVTAQLANCRRLASWLDREGRLASPWTVRSATDMLFGLISSDMIEKLTVDRGWSQSRLARHLAVLFESTFVTGPASAGQSAAQPGRRMRPASLRNDS
ncbi:MAG: TetR/AcrR family transcriptional regulator [Actinobacteria bacterium]|nr:TetR/AcrR family transcriptional regulator [Actinomycetota bacterium]